MLALSLGVFALSYSATWSSSQQDQAAYQAGADVRATRRPRRTARHRCLPAAYAGVPGVEAAMPVERISSRHLAGQGHGRSPRARCRHSRVGRPFPIRRGNAADRRAHGRSARGSTGAASRHAADDTGYLQLDALFDISRIVRAALELRLGRHDAARSSDADRRLTVSATAIVRDAHGLIYRLAPSIRASHQRPTRRSSPARTDQLAGAARARRTAARRDTTEQHAHVERADRRYRRCPPVAVADGPWTPLPLDGMGSTNGGWRAQPKPVERPRTSTRWSSRSTRMIG